MRCLNPHAAAGAILALTLAFAIPGPARSIGDLHSERARSAAAFIDAIGVNVHLSYRDTGYGNRNRVAQLLEQLGVRHLRDGVTLGQTDVGNADRNLARQGFRFTFITQANPTSEQLRAWASCTGPAVEAFEGLNEYDISHPPSDVDWTATVRTSQHALYRSVKTTPQLAALPVVAPSLTTEAAYRDVGDLSSDLDVGSMHDYFSFHEPETKGWGADGYGSIAFNMRVARAVVAEKPIASTETGYGTDRSNNTVDAVTQAVYLPRLLLEHFAAGVTRTFPYELIDEGGDPFGHYGIVDRNLVPKPAFSALASLIASLRDSTAAFQTGTLPLSIDGDANDVHHVLLQKRDGRFVLALWVAAPSFDAGAHAASAVPPRNVTIRVGRRIRSAALSRYGTDWQLHRTAIPAATSVPVAVSNRVSLLELVPAAGN